ncbi:hypothetical protein HF1_11130 [Mycoplasma haemofelis str. Langford 1]|uniref:Uncharacterized protein n=1 Tax=Mycoplasma haemofelis (strain Langford 1) TaxID=941640 RepID=E8ZJ00_MYCHL|nr:hypothetical protein [Mycoplasma haemofelis]CBY93121.1 hypothetical protein HF1_11130 [Mycoplasma haemofelis str. Langford 1]
MALSTAAKSAIGLGTVGGVTGSAIGANYLLSKDPNIPELIKSKNPEKRLLDKNSSAEAWKAAWKAYREANNSKEKDIWSIEGWKKESSVADAEAPEAFRKGCASRIEGSSKLYDEVISYCTRKTTLADLISDDSGRRLLVKTDKGDTPEWKAVWSAYKKVNTTQSKDKDEWKLDNWESDSKKEEASDAFMDKCKTNSETEGYDPNTPLYQQLLKYCTVEISK